MKTDVPKRLSHPTPGNLYKQNEMSTWESYCTPGTIAKKHNQPRCQSTDDWVMQDIYTIEYYSVIQKRMKRCAL